MATRNWTREELLLTLNLYCKLPFSKFAQGTPEIRHLARIIGRTPGAVAMKLSNFASLDDSLTQRGLINASKLDKEIWEEFTGDWGQVALESELILEAKTHNKDIVETLDELIDTQQTTEMDKIVKARIGQQFFRSTILGNYNTRCCICEMPIESLLIASHIVPWHADISIRLNPRNGLSLCATHDKAFDRGLIAVDDQYCVLLSSEIRQLEEYQAVASFFGNFQHKLIHMPEKFTPQQSFLEYHRDNIFAG